MKDSVPSKAEQIEALINHEAYGFTLRYAGRDESGRPRYSRVFTVTRKEIEEYFRQHYRLDNIPASRNSEGPEEGYYIIALPGGRYHIYYQEKGSRGPEVWANSEDEAWRFVTDYMLKTSGTGTWYK